VIWKRGKIMFVIEISNKRRNVHMGKREFIETTCPLR